MPDSPTFTIDIASVSDRNRLVAEVWVGDTQWAEVLCENGRDLEVEFYPKPDGTPWRLPLREALEAVERAAKSLRGE
jgi:hypothetical protein